MSYSLAPTPNLTVSHLVTLTCTGATQEQAIIFSNLDAQEGFVFTTGQSKIYAPSTGHYLVSISAISDTTTNATRTTDIWIKVNGSNLANSNTQVAANTSGVQTTLACNYVLPLTKGQYFEFWWRGSGTEARLLYVAAAATPTRPACPSVIVTVVKVGK